MAVPYFINQGTVKPVHPFDAKHDAEALRHAMKGLGTDEKAIIRILANRTFAQRSKIALEYKTLFGKDLVSNLKKELSGNFEDVIVAVMLPRAEYLAKCVHKAIKGLGTKEKTIIEVLCTSSNAEIHEVNAAYQREFKTSMEKDIKGDTSGYFERLLVALNVGNRDENPHVDQTKAFADAQALYQAGEKHWGTNESVFTAILVSQSYAQLRLVFQEYERVAHHSIEKALSNEMSGDLLDGMLALVQCIRNKIGYFANRLQHALEGMGTGDSTLIRVIVSRSEIDLQLIKDEFYRQTGRTLSNKISSDTSGDYKKMLLEIVKE